MGLRRAVLTTAVLGAAISAPTGPAHASRTDGPPCAVEILEARLDARDRPDLLTALRERCRPFVRDCSFRVDPEWTQTSRDPMRATVSGRVAWPGAPDGQIFYARAGQTVRIECPVGPARRSGGALRITVN